VSGHPSPEYATFLAPPPLPTHPIQSKLYLDKILCYFLSAGILSDTILVVIPIYNLRHLKTAPGFRRMLMIIFGSSALLTAATIIQAAITIQLPGDPELIATLTEVSFGVSARIWNKSCSFVRDLLLFFFATYRSS
jgi:hypothetical protein